MKKIVFTAVMLFAIAGFIQAQTSATKVTTQKKEITKPASSVNAVSSATKKSTGNKKTNSPGPGQKVIGAYPGKHKKAKHKIKKPAKKS